jgi:electron transport complex protein RnfB
MNMVDLIAQQPLLAALVALGGLAIVFGGILGFAAVKFRVEGDPIVERIDALLPQTQCGQCGYPGCRPYAEAIANGDIINKCPPGGQATINALADLLDVPAPELDGEAVEVKKVAFIREAECIGCTKCIQACPVDAILGAAKQMHTVIASECTGCDLCVEPCPVDCIEMRPVAQTLADWKWDVPAPLGERLKGLRSADLIATDRPRATTGKDRAA